MAWPNGPEASDVTPEPVNTTTWTVSPYYKKSCEEHEHYVKDGMTIIRKTGFRGASFIVETNDGNPPKFEFGFVPGGDGAKDSLNMYDFPGSNIENVELDSMWDGCWEDIEFPEEMDDDEKERLQELIEESGDVYDVLENQEEWSQYETEAWIWGPILIEGDNGFRKIVVADEDGNCVEYKDE